MHVTAVNGQTAIERLQTDRPEAVLLDYMMPVVNGTAVLDAMQEDVRLSDIAVIMKSSLDEEVIRRTCKGIPHVSAEAISSRGNARRVAAGHALSPDQAP